MLPEDVGRWIENQAGVRSFLPFSEFSPPPLTSPAPWGPFAQFRSSCIRRLAGSWIESERVSVNERLKDPLATQPMSRRGGSFVPPSADSG